MVTRKDKETQCELCHKAYHKFFIWLDRADLQYLNNERELRLFREEGHLYSIPASIS
jgi:hypothetical protein